MKASISIGLLLVFVVGCSVNLPYSIKTPYDNPPYRGFTPPDRAQWQPLTAMDQVVVYAQKTLYQLPSRDRSYVRIRVENTSERGVLVDLSDYGHCVRPVQWSQYEAGSISTSQPGGLPAGHDVPLARRQRILNDFVAGHMVEIPPKSSVDYFRDFGVPNQPQGTPTKTGKLLVVLTGRVYITDGRLVESLAIRPDSPSSRLILPVTGELPLVPMGYLIQESHGPAILMPATAPAVYMSPES
jgi:hypothetical protein